MPTLWYSLCSPCADFFSLSRILERILVRDFLRELLKHISFHSDFVCKRRQRLQRAQTNIGQKVLYFTARQLSQRVCRCWRQACGLHKTIVKHNIPAPRDGLQMVAPNLRATQNHCKTQCSSSQRGSVDATFFPYMQP